MNLASAVQPAPGVYEGAANVIAAVMLLIEFGMLRQALARDQVRLYAAQSALISVLAVVIAADRNLPDLYALAALSAALKVVAVPLVLRRLLGRTAPDEEEPAGVAGSHALSPATAVLAGIVLAAFGFFCFGGLKIHGPAAPATALAIAAAMVLVAFGLMIVRQDVASQAIGVPRAGERDLAGRAGGGGRAAADPGDRVPVRPAGGGGGVRHADPRAPHQGRVAVHRRPDPAAGVSR